MSDESVPPVEPTVNIERYSQLIAELEMKQSLVGALVAGLVASIVGAAIWAGITIATEYQIGWVAIGIGFLVGFAVRILGKGINMQYGIIGGAFALLGCVLGNFFAIVGFVSIQEGLGFFELLFAIDYAYIPEIMMEAFHPMDLLFYGLAIYAGYKFSFRPLKPEEVEQVIDTE
ncbi:MAG: hypothetical protein AB3N64_06685 [Puniceicoccaceae bacterium]